MPFHIGKSFLLVSGHRGILDKVRPGPKEALRATEHPASLPPKRSGLLAAIPRISVHRVRTATLHGTPSRFKAAMAKLPQVNSEQEVGGRIDNYLRSALDSLLPGQQVILIVATDHAMKAGIMARVAALVTTGAHERTADGAKTFLSEDAPEKLQGLDEVSDTLLDNFREEEMAPALTDAERDERLCAIVENGSQDDKTAIAYCAAKLSAFETGTFDVGSNEKDVLRREAKMLSHIDGVLQERGGTLVLDCGLMHFQALHEHFTKAAATATGGGPPPLVLGIAQYPTAPAMAGHPSTAHTRARLSYPAMSTDVLSFQPSDELEAAPFNFVAFGQEVLARGS